ncbi:cyclin-dependent kinase 12/13 [Nematocida minor]|uniref:cyclin-dependent kinase 12/13 n=1 Tax=Nematocida minor TaxID=1912983 RepID=UPI002220CD51|nr:cyclin-dependent kinase 12/13 [Nematocida minor]KAI5189697.1 cyclin-dependent kinase 12/13 [Nematocida minor]
MFKSDSGEPVYRIVKKVGEGTFGKVYKGKETATNKKVALKKIKLKNEQDGVPVTLIREISILKALSHKNIINLLDSFIQDRDKVHNFKKTSYSIFLVFPFIKTDLLALIKRKQIEVKDAISYTEQILQGLAYIHSKHILHRDIKPSNILVRSDKTVKIADFGLSRTTIDENMTRGTVTRWYRAPELLLGCSRYDNSIDVWALGCVIGEMLLSKPLFVAESEMDQLSAISFMCGEIKTEVFKKNMVMESLNKVIFGKSKKAKIRETFIKHSELLAFLIESMLKIAPDKRITAEDALKFIQSAISI